MSKSVKSTSVPALQTASGTAPESLLLDVGIAVFDAGLESVEEADENEPRVYAEVRRAEARFIPGQLSRAMQDSGAWGAVRVLPDDSQITDLLINGRIVHSDGESLRLEITATDSRGFTWLQKTYTDHVSSYAYTLTERTTMDPFQAIYHNIANDLLARLEKLSSEDLRNVRLVTELRFARSFSPDAFDGYLAKNPKGRYLLMRLPAEDDPMLERVRRIRKRDHLFVDTLQEYYVGFDEQMSGPYDEWRKLSYEEVVQLREVQAESRRQMVAGAAAVIGGILAEITQDNRDGPGRRAAGDLAIIGGAYLFKSGLLKRNEAQIHVEALDELGSSLETEVAPKVIELEDRTVTLSGNVEEQYAQWRSLLAEIYRAEIGDLAPPGASAAAGDTL